MRVIAHIDLNAFFVNAEIIKNPQLKGKKIAVGYDGRTGVVSTCSYEARKVGITSGMSTLAAKKSCPDLILVDGDYHFYARLSRHFFQIIASYSPQIEIASIDECYVDLTDYIVGDPLTYIAAIQQDVFQKTELTCSIGVASNKFLAKMASNMKKPNGLTVLRKRELKTKLWPLPVGEMFGIGKASAPKLVAAGYQTIGDLAIADRYQLRLILGSYADSVIAHANGEGDDKVETSSDDPKSIGSSSTFHFNTDDTNDIIAHLNEIAATVARRAQRAKMVGKKVTLTIRYSDFTTHTHQMAIRKMSNAQEDLFYYGKLLFDRIYRGGQVRLLGITLSALSQEQHFYEQMDFVEYIRRELRRKKDETD